MVKRPKPSVTCQVCGATAYALRTPQACTPYVSICERCSVELDPATGMPIMPCGDCERCAAMKEADAFDHWVAIRKKVTEKALANQQQG